IEMAETASHSLINKIIKQVEYYFSDSNFPSDKFLRGEASKNTDVNIDVIAAFNRMKNLTIDLQLITDSLRSSERLQVSDDGKMVRRTDPLPDNEEHSKKTLYSKGWPTDTTTIDTVEEFFRPYGRVLSVRLRKRKDRGFKGSLLADFETEDIVNKIIADAPKLHDTVELLYQTYKQFAAEKKEQDALFLKAKKQAKVKNHEVNTNGTHSDDKDNDNDNDADEPLTMVKGCLLTFKGIGQGLHYGDIKSTFAQYGDVEFVEYRENCDNGQVRYKTPESAKRALTSMVSEKKQLAGKIPQLCILEGVEEQQAWDKIVASRKANNKDSVGKRKGGKQGRSTSTTSSTSSKGFSSK
ncbi:hypothetical protein SAMD00019534_030820, partial [Acytostelium subglobosum LB1]|uniref:hypothetical protein n=1 Tax=Acytostelium subglobosum LB1 TaxID=1410327 RepID=UPI000644F0B8